MNGSFGSSSACQNPAMNGVSRPGAVVYRSDFVTGGSVIRRYQELVKLADDFNCLHLWLAKHPLQGIENRSLQVY